MKAVLIVHNAAIDEEVNEALESVGINCYTKFTNTLGKGEISQPHLNTDIWPGVNYGTFVVTNARNTPYARQTEFARPEGIYVAD